MAKISGAKVKVYIGNVLNGKVLAGQQGAILNRSAETIDATTKTPDGWKKWSLDCDKAFVESDEAYEELEAAYHSSKNVVVCLEFPSGEKYSGKATIVDIPLVENFDDLVKYSLSLQGSGALTKTKA